MTVLTGLFGLIATPAGRAAGMLMTAALIGGGLYLTGRSDGGAACLLQGERDVTDTILRADGARAAAERRDANADRLRDDDAFRRD